jgi:L-fuculose-phosphate aldolase
VNAVVHSHPPLCTGFAVAGIPLDRAVLAEVVTTLGSIPIAEVRHALHARNGGYGAAAHQGPRRSAAGQPRRSDAGADLFQAYYKMETIEHFAQISLVARQLGTRASALARGSRPAAGAARDVRHRRAGTHLRRSRARGSDSDPSCQTVYAPEAPGERLVPDTSVASGSPAIGNDGEIRLTYAQLTELIDEAVKQIVKT